MYLDRVFTSAKGMLKMITDNNLYFLLLIEIGLIVQLLKLLGTGNMTTFFDYMVMKHHGAICMS